MGREAVASIKEILELFTTFENYPACSVVQTLEYHERCFYVQSTPECQEISYYINYIKLLYCGLEPKNDFQQAVGVGLMLSISCIMFLILAITADKILCPALTVISTVLGLNEHFAGVTLLAFGNGSPDLFTSLMSLKNNPRPIFGDLYGSAVYVNAFVAGIIIFLNPFRMHPNNVIRDTSFLLFSLLYMDYAIVSDGYVTIVEASNLQKKVKTRKFATEANIYRLVQLKDEANIEIFKRGSYMSESSRISIDVAYTRSIAYNSKRKPNSKIFSQFIETINPFDAVGWYSGGYVQRTIIIVKIPINLILSVIIPVVDYELDKHGWSKLLNLLQLNFLPLLLASAIFYGKYLYGIPIPIFPLFVTIPISIIILLTTRTDIPPSYHALFAVYSCAGSIFVIYSCASETVSIFYVLGIVLNCSNSFVGVTLLAWGNAIGDLVANISLSLSGYQQMGYAACFGGSFFISTLSMGITYLYESVNSPLGYVVVQRGHLGENCLVFLAIILSSNYIWGAVTGFCARRSIGAFLIFLYFVFFTYCLLGELEIVQTYAGDTPTGLP